VSAHLNKTGTADREEKDAAVLGVSGFEPYLEPVADRLNDFGPQWDSSLHTGFHVGEVHNACVQIHGTRRECGQVALTKPSVCGQKHHRPQWLIAPGEYGVNLRGFKHSVSMHGAVGLARNANLFELRLVESLAEAKRSRNQAL